MKGASEFNATESNEYVITDVISLSEIRNLNNSAIPLNTLFGIILSKLLPLFSVECGAIIIYDEELTIIKKAYISVYTVASDQIETSIISIPAELTPLQKTIAEFPFPVMKSGEEWIAEENTNHQCLQSEIQYQYHAYLPIEFDNKILGTLELHNNERALSAECLTFSSNIADLLAEIIYFSQRNLPLPDDYSKESSVAGQQQGKDHNIPKQINNDQLLAELNEKLADIKDIDSLSDFVNRAAKLFPKGYKKIKAQLDEIAIYKTQLEDDQVHVPDSLETSKNFPDIIGDGPAINKVFIQLDQVSGSDTTVLILGETGTGKELIARAIHESSERKDKIMIGVNCAAIPANLIESELFGHEKGAFTGATELRIGKFEMANNSTLFLDEIGELPLDLQVKLLRVLQEQEIERVGGKSTIKINVRVISATNRNLLKEVEQGRFRQDLYYRLNIFPILLPPLRDRIEDIPLLASHFLSKYGKEKSGFSRRAIKQMTNYNWPGNIRELKHLIERQVLLNTNTVIKEVAIPKTVITVINEGGIPKKIKTIDENERDHIFSVLQICKGRISGQDGAAKLLGVPATTLNSKIKRLGLNKRHS